jgi:hypothetical protein
VLEVLKPILTLVCLKRLLLFLVTFSTCEMVAHLLEVCEVWLYLLGFLQDCVMLAI